MSVLMLLWAGGAQAQGLRDPTIPPAAAGLPGTASSANPLNVEAGSMSVIVRNGRPYLVVGTRLYAAGEKLGQARIERITETEIWMREGGVRRKVPLFVGIQRRAASSPPKNSLNDSKSSHHD